MFSDYTRRDLLRSGLAAGIVTLAWPKILQAKNGSGGLYWSAFANADNSYGMAVFDLQGDFIFEKTLPDRGHGAAISNIYGHLAITERRPGWFGQIWDISADRLIAELKLPKGRHFYGHASYLGNRLFTTENSYDEERGVIGVWDASNGYKRIAEFDAGGIGPHEMRILENGREMVIASGGILTHPADGRSKLNIPDMTPKLAWLDCKSGKVLREWAPETKWHKASIRHLTVNAQGDVFFGMQYQGSRRERAPLVGIARREGDAMISELPIDVHKSTQNYCGSVELDSSATIMAASTPRGNKVIFFDARDSSYLDHVDITDACGVIAAMNRPEQFLISSGNGGLYLHNVHHRETVLITQTNKRWDNHMMYIG
ncbi:DUF1513 domain-containing protein [Curvivirga aplysinae]|uniref:DUF1513 domain-containing protein n=1 Tax=Curvivirga aplysinae TaxID=2529852 RepID=UPI0012BD1579|nr:DUF1513 domain-containing protein [Curvivirga aplysinae]MTI09175.1 DUF1513 domain-containing protein [Curvivirga aplysinae]